MITVVSLTEIQDACQTKTFRGGKVISRVFESPYLDIVVEFTDGHLETFRA